LLFSYYRNVACNCEHVFANSHPRPTPVFWVGAPPIVKIVMRVRPVFIFSQTTETLRRACSHIVWDLQSSSFKIVVWIWRTDVWILFCIWEGVL